MQDNLDNIIIESDDIKNIYVLASDDKKIASVYVLLNDGNVERIDRFANTSYDYYLKAICSFFKNIGLDNSNKNSKWFVTKRENKRGIDYDTLDKIYINKHSPKKNLETEEYDILKIDKSLEEYNNLDDEEAKSKSKLITDLVSAGLMSLLTFYSYNSNGYTASKSNIVLTLDAFILVSALFNSILLGISKNAKKELVKEKGIKEYLS